MINAWINRAWITRVPKTYVRDGRNMETDALETHQYKDHHVLPN